MSGKIIVIGLGRMARAMIDGYVKASRKTHTQPLKNWVLIAPRKKPYLKDWISQGAEYHTHLTHKLAEQAELILLAVKPKHMTELGPELAPLLTSNPLVISVLAGLTLKEYEAYWGETCPVLRAMPNTPAEIQQSMTVIIANSACTKTQINTAKTLLLKIGEVEEIKDEALMNVVTGISGSGPAYVFLFAEILIHLAQDEGLSEPLAKKLVTQTLSGSADLLKTSPEDAKTLRENVTSPGGTTEAALNLLNSETGLPQLLRHAALKAITHSRRLQSRTDLVF